MFKNWNIFLILAVALFASQVIALESFLVQKFRFEGLARVSEGTVYNYLPFKAGDYLDPLHSSGIIRALFKTGFFEDVHLAREGQTLVIHFKERPAIARIQVHGNKSIKTEQLMSSLKGVGLAEGRTYDPSLLELIERDLERQFLNTGKYALKVQTEVKPLERNRVEIDIRMQEGETASIREITIVGAKQFSPRKVRSLMSLSTPWLFSWLTRDDQYSKTKLANDLESIRNFYLDHGYLNVQLNSSQVSISKDKGSIYLTINLNEGARYTISAVNLEGDWIVPTTEIASLVTIKPGSYFSRAEVSNTIKAMNERLGKEGYAFARIEPIPTIDEAHHTTSLSFHCDPGRRMYARRIMFSGNERTKDKVLRRELTQLEAAPLSTTTIEDSRTRLNRTGYFSAVEIETKPVEDKIDEVDLHIAVQEAQLGTVGGSIGYSSEDGILFGANFNNRNFLGSGNSIGFNFNNSKSFTNYSISYENPYYTPEGISRGFSLFYSKAEPSATSNVVDYNTGITGGTVHYSFPMTALSRISAGYGYQNTILKIGKLVEASDQIRLFTHNQERTRYEEFLGFGGWSYNTLDRYLFPEKGRQVNVDLNGSVLGNVRYYGLGFRHQWYQPLTQGFVLIHNIQGAYGDGYGHTHGLPFYKHYYAGGARSVRGFQENSLGPKDSQGKTFGGNLLFTTSLSLAIPDFFSEGTSSTRTTVFVDAGQVWDTKPLAGVVGANGLRFSVGVSLTWVSPVGPLVFNIARPLKTYSTPYRDSSGALQLANDKEEWFSFGFGTNF